MSDTSISLHFSERLTLNLGVKIYVLVHIKGNKYLQMFSNGIYVLVLMLGNMNMSCD